MSSPSLGAQHATPPMLPKLLTVLGEGYNLEKLRADALAGLTVAIVALPLSMAIAIASGTGPERGLYTAIVGGFLISLLGGSRFQIGGPAGAFIVLVAAIIERQGLDGFLLATMMAGVILIAMGALRLGTYIKYIPHPVVVGFTAGIAVIIFASQVRDLLGLTLSGHEPAALLPKLAALAQAIATINPAAVAVAACALAIILGLRLYQPAWPAFLIAVAVSGALAWALGLPVETIGSRFGEIPRTLPAPALPEISLARIGGLLPDAVAIAILGGIESLLSAVVADGMTGRRHRSNTELMAQGAANIGAALFGGLCATGTIARTATNVRAGAVGPISGILHSLFLLVMMLLAAPLMSLIPLAALGAVLAVVAWNMAERHAFAALLRTSWGDAVVLLATFLLTIFRDLTEGIAVGVILGSFLFMHRMASLVAVEARGSLDVADQDEAKANGELAASERAAYDRSIAEGSDIVVYRIAGPLFFGATSSVSAVLDRIGSTPRAFVLDLSAVPFIDSTAAASLKSFVERMKRSGTLVILAAASPPLRRSLLQEGLGPRFVRHARSVEQAMEAARQTTASPSGDP